MGGGRKGGGSDNSFVQRGREGGGESDMTKDLYRGGGWVGWELIRQQLCVWGGGDQKTAGGWGWGRDQM